MKKHRVLCGAVAAVMMVSMAGCGSSASAPAAKAEGGVLELKLSHPAATEHPYHLAAEKFKEIVERDTNGAVKITIFPANQLGSQEEVTEAAQLGTIDLVITSDDKLVNIVPEFGALGMPFLFEDTDHVYEVLNGEVGDLLSGKMEEKNMMVISWLENGFRNITNNKQPIVVPADLKGIKIRTSSTKPNMEAFNTYGASATNISFSELYSALQLNTVDAQENPLTNILDKKFFEVQKFLSMSGHVHTSEPMIMSKSSFDKLTDEQKEVFKKAGKEISAWAFENSKEQFDTELSQLKEKGMEVNEIDRQAFVDASQPVYDKFYGQYKEIIDKIKK